MLTICAPQSDARGGRTVILGKAKPQTAVRSCSSTKPAGVTPRHPWSGTLSRHLKDFEMNFRYFRYDKRLLRNFLSTVALRRFCPVFWT